jgi:hypothetical protein
MSWMYVTLVHCDDCIPTAWARTWVRGYEGAQEAVHGAELHVGGYQVLEREQPVPDGRAHDRGR